MIEFEQVSKIYDNKFVALEDVSFVIEDGEFVSIVGHSGAGKTTITRLLLGEEKPTNGSVYLDSIDVARLSSSKIVSLRRRIGTVFQDYKLLPSRTAYENIAFAMEVAGKTDEEIANDVPHVLDLVDLTDKTDHFPRQLSGGEKQRLAIARAIINQPDLIIADEPTGNLDPVNTHEIIQILKKINDLGTTVILTTHDPNIVESIGKRVITFEGGTIKRDVKKGKYII
ncbi:cell division ATP-binding protein FtsE [Candidatus Parcubacteria bacterium]|nr:cell division ATP-binding protein FtsE [Candidatus Parcubacteria bacterium]